MQKRLGVIRIKIKRLAIEPSRILELLTERSGDAEGASLLQSRARRAQSKLKP